MFWPTSAVALFCVIRLVTSCVEMQSIRYMYIGATRFHVRCICDKEVFDEDTEKIPA
jgi:hypothetical protein